MLLERLAPEQVAGMEREQGPPTDLYALGCLVWELVTGGPVFPGNSAAIMEGHRLLEPPPLVPRMPVPSGRLVGSVQATATAGL